MSFLRKFKADKTRLTTAEKKQAMLQALQEEEKMFESHRWRNMMSTSSWSDDFAEFGRALKTMKDHLEKCGTNGPTLEKVIQDAEDLLERVERHMQNSAPKSIGKTFHPRLSRRQKYLYQRTEDQVAHYIETLERRRNW